jgi:hypothetical protein
MKRKLLLLLAIFGGLGCLMIWAIPPRKLEWRVQAQVKTYTVCPIVPGHCWEVTGVRR